MPREHELYDTFEDTRPYAVLQLCKQKIHVQRDLSVLN
jgi:hypothetical protein